MYKIFLCLRYLRTRYIVLASIISVMLGVATMIVVNSVMSGFANEMQTRIHGILGDLMVSSTSSDGFYDPEGQMQKIRDALGDKVTGMTPICTTVGVLTYKTRVLDADGFEREAQLTEQVCIVGVDENSKASVGDFGKFLQHPENRKSLSFDLRKDGYDTFESQKMKQSRGLLGKLFPVSVEDAVKAGKLKERTDMKKAGWKHRQEYYADPAPGVEIITNPELHVETKNTQAVELPSMKKPEDSQTDRLDMIDTSKPAVTLSDHPMDNPPDLSEAVSPFDAAQKAQSEQNLAAGTGAAGAGAAGTGAAGTEAAGIGAAGTGAAGTAPGQTAANAETVPAADGTVPAANMENAGNAEIAGNVENAGGTGNAGNAEAGNSENSEFNLEDSLAAMENNYSHEADTDAGLGMDVENPFGDPVGGVFDPLTETHPGIIVGIGMGMYRNSSGDERFYLLPGRDVMLTFPDCSIRPQGVSGHFTCVDFYESKMSEYDSQFVFVSMSTLQELRGMPNKANQIQIQLREGVDLDEACEALRKVFDPQLFVCKTWRDDKMPLLQAVDMEIAILNVLLFMIIAVSGFGILAIFFMVVSEKTRDIGILKALGASSWGIMTIFLMYGLGLGIVGAGLGLVLGLMFVCNINEIADFLSWILGHEVFSPDIYYFYQIPYDISLSTVGWIVGGALIIAVLASVFPAWHASRLQPVESLRYE